MQVQFPLPVKMSHTVTTLDFTLHIKCKSSYYYNNLSKDEGDFIGCFMKKSQSGLLAYGRQVPTLTPCYCIGYCYSLNFTFAGAYNG